ncbi:MAG: DUF2339 domain-containing protein, partial [Myxococcota bacterium]
MRVLATALGFALGLGTEVDGWRAVLGAVLAFVLAQGLHGVRRELQALRLRLAGTAPASPVPAPPRTIVPETVTAPMAPPAPTLPAARASEPSASVPPLERWLADQTVRARAWLIGGNLPVRVGVVVLLLGVSFLAKYAAEHSLFPVEARLATAALLGMALVGIGWRLRTSQRAFALPLQGGGIGMLYIVVFVALRLYTLVPAPLALALLVVLAASAASLAVLQSSQTLAVFAFGGGFAAPVLTSTGGGNHVALFTYYAVLNLALLGVAYRRAWRPLHLVGFFFTFGVGTMWGVSRYTPADYVSAQLFLILFVALYLVVAVLYARRQPPRLVGLVDGTLVFGLPVVALGLQAGLVARFEYGLAVSAAALGLVYTGLAAILWRKAAPGLRALIEALLAIGIIFGTMALPLAVDARWTGVGWALEGAGLVWVGVRQQRLRARLSGALLLVGAGVAMLMHGYPGPQGVVGLNGFHLSALVIAASALFAAWRLERAREGLGNIDRAVGYALLVWGLAWLALPTLYDFDERYRVAVALPMDVLFFTVAAAAFELFGRRWASSTARRVALALLPLMGVVLLVA